MRERSPKRCREETPRTPRSESSTECHNDEVRRLLAIAAEDDDEPLSRVQAVAKLETLARQAKERMVAVKPRAVAEVESGAINADAAELGKPFFTPAQAQQAKDAVTALQNAIAEACRSQPTSAQATLQLNVKFVSPVSSASVLVAKIQALHGAKGPVVNTQPLEASNSTWRKPGMSVWHAEKKGDTRNCVYRVHIPPDAGHRKPRNISFQVGVAGRELLVKGTKNVLLQFALNVVLQFGPHRGVELAKTHANNVCLDDFWGTRA